MEGSRGLDSGTGDGGPQGADNGGTEHGESWMDQKSAKATNLITRYKKRKGSGGRLKVKMDGERNRRGEEEEDGRK